jgi:hypothetical protein
MDNIIQHKVLTGDHIVDSQLIESRSFYLLRFNTLPSVHMVYGVNAPKAVKALQATYADKIEQAFIRDCRYVNVNIKKWDFEEALLVFNNKVTLNIASNYCEILHPPKEKEFVNELYNFLRKFRKPVKRQPYEINLVVAGSQGLILKSMEFKKTKLDLDLYYEDGFKEIDQLIHKRLNTKKDKGIVLLHGIPGTGKTTYLRYLIGRLKKRVLFLSPSLAQNLMQPSFVDLLINNPNTIIVIEDAENIIMDRKVTGDSTVSNLLNMSDGLLADCLNVQIICTFNSHLSLIDDALMRKGRLIARYEFGKLSVTKAQHLSYKQGFDTIIREPMTLAEIMNQDEKAYKKETTAIGFSRV